MPDHLQLLGLIGKPLSHSFSKSYFTEKFRKLGIKDFAYELFELGSIDEFTTFIKQTPGLAGLNVTIPYKQEVMPFLDEISGEARAIGAVNVIKIQGEKLSGFNTDYYGCKTALFNWLPDHWQGKALILGSGGASLAVSAVLTDNKIPFQLVSRNPGPDKITYEQLKQLNLIPSHKLIINTTPLGMHPNIETLPELHYEKLGPDHYLFDLVYNPETTAFMKKGLKYGAKVKNGLEMLKLQAEKSWEIWTGNQYAGNS